MSKTTYLSKVSEMRVLEVLRELTTNHSSDFIASENNFNRAVKNFQDRKFGQPVGLSLTDQNRVLKYCSILPKNAGSLNFYLWGGSNKLIHPASDELRDIISKRTKQSIIFVFVKGYGEAKEVEVGSNRVIIARGAGQMTEYLQKELKRLNKDKR